jgi:class 3 adenylate cyclase
VGFVDVTRQGEPDRPGENLQRDGALERAPRRGRAAHHGHTGVHRTDADDAATTSSNFGDVGGQFRVGSCGTVDRFTGDGIVALFGAPTALADHAFRACLTALDIQTMTGRLAAELVRRDGVILQLRIGLNSGQVIAGEIGSSTASYTAIGEQVGMAQRIESVAPLGGVMLGEATARLVENTVVLGVPEMVHIKGADLPVPARRLLAIGDHQPDRRSESPLDDDVMEEGEPAEMGALIHLTKTETFTGNSP